MNISIKHAKCARINVFEFKKIWKLYDSYSAFQGVEQLASD